MYPCSHTASATSWVLRAFWSVASRGALALLPALALGGDCPAPVPFEQLEGDLRSAEEAWAALDAAGFIARSDEVVLALPCVAVALTSSAAARVHRLQGLRYYVEDQGLDAALAFAAARAADPALSMGGLAPPGHELWRLFALQPIGEAKDVLPAPVVGRVLLDGQTSLRRDPARPVLFQLVNDDGQAALTDWVEAEGALPPYPSEPIERPAAPDIVSLPEEPDALPTVKQPSTPRPGLRRAGGAVLGVGLAALVGGGILYGVSAGQRADFDRVHPDWELDDAHAAQRRVNGLTIAGATSAGVGLVASVTGLVLVF